MKKTNSWIWRPFTSLCEQREPLYITHARGLYLYTSDGRAIADMNASWWVNLHGHSHPHIQEAIIRQLHRFSHVMFSNCTHEAAEHAATLLKNYLPGSHTRIFYSDNGSTAVEVGLKIASQYFYLSGENRKRFLALHGGYHGDTFGGMSAAERNLFNQPFSSLLFETHFINPPVDENPSKILEELEEEHRHSPFIAFIYEPLVQGAAGMKFHHPEGLRKITEWCRQHHILCIADEVMTGLGRTGTFLASEQTCTEPDILCLSKGLTGGTMPLGVTTIHEKIVEVFKKPFPQHTFYHGHSFTAYALACSALGANLELFEKENTLPKIRAIEKSYLDEKESIMNHPLVSNLRIKGSICALEIKYENEEHDYLHPLKGKLYDFFLENDILIRPLGNTFYLIPPYCVRPEEIRYSFGILKKFLDQIL